MLIDLEFSAEKNRLQRFFIDTDHSIINIDWKD